LQRSFLCRWSALFVTEGGDGIEAAGAQGREEPAQSAEKRREREGAGNQPPAEAEDGQVERDALLPGDGGDDRVAGDRVDGTRRLAHERDAGAGKSKPHARQAPLDTPRRNSSAPYASLDTTTRNRTRGWCRRGDSNPGPSV